VPLHQDAADLRDNGDIGGLLECQMSKRAVYHSSNFLYVQARSEDSPPP
jgi:hypothetical protein